MFAFYNKEKLDLYIISAYDRTNLHNKIRIDLRELILETQLTFEAKWLPDSSIPLSAMHTPNLGFKISIIDNMEFNENNSESVMRPQILYKQTESFLFVQSIMENTDNYRLRDKINLFIHKYNDPGVLLGKIEIDRKKLDNFGSVNLIMNYKEKISISTDHSYIYIEDNDASTYYKF